MLSAGSAVKPDNHAGAPALRQFLQPADKIGYPVGTVQRDARAAGLPYREGV